MTTDTETTDDDSTEQKTTGAGPGITIPDAPNFDPEEWTVEEIVWAIESAVLGKPDGHPLTLSQLNSVYAYFTGEFHFHPADYGTDRSPEGGEVRQDISLQAAFDYERGESMNRAYRKDELVALLRAIATRSDQREWV
jgi:hypothetical protein